MGFDMEESNIKLVIVITGYVLTVLIEYGR